MADSYDPKVKPYFRGAFTTVNNLIGPLYKSSGSKGQPTAPRRTSAAASRRRCVVVTSALDPRLAGGACPVELWRVGFSVTSAGDACTVFCRACFAIAVQTSIEPPHSRLHSEGARMVHTVC